MTDVKYDLSELSKSHSGKIYDVCIAGTGAAGITLALGLEKKGWKVALLEGGDLQYSERSQSLYHGKSVGLPYEGRIRACRLRYLGGATNHWAGRCMQLQPVDFEKKSYIPLPGWPIKKEDLDKYTENAAQILDLGEQTFEPKRIEVFDESTMRTVGLTRSAPTRFGQKYLPELEKSKNIDLYINANVTEIVLSDQHNSVTGLNVKTYSGESIKFKGSHYVIAMGALENARLLLNSDKQEREGLGNHSGFVGRCFMEHLQVDLGRFVIDPDSPVWKDNNLELFPRKIQ